MVFSEIYGTGAKDSEREKIGRGTPESGMPVKESYSQKWWMDGNHRNL